MTSFCKVYGQCDQCDTCPLRTGIGLPHQAACARRFDATGCAKEGGNVWFVGPEPLTLLESITIYCALGVLSVISLGLMATGIGFIYQRFSN